MVRAGGGGRGGWSEGSAEGGWAGVGLAGVEESGTGSCLGRGFMVEVTE